MMDIFLGVNNSHNNPKMYRLNDSGSVTLSYHLPNNDLGFESSLIIVDKINNLYHIGNECIVHPQLLHKMYDYQ